MAYSTIAICFSGNAALIMRVIRSLDKFLSGLNIFEVGFRDSRKYGFVLWMVSRDGVPSGVLFLSLTTNILFNQTLLNI
jgi:hypothetical protein